MSVFLSCVKITTTTKNGIFKSKRNCGISSKADGNEESWLVYLANVSYVTFQVLMQGRWWPCLLLGFWFNIQDGALCSTSMVSELAQKRWLPYWAVLHWDLTRAQICFSRFFYPPRLCAIAFISFPAQ